MSPFIKDARTKKTLFQFSKKPAKTPAQLRQAEAQRLQAEAAQQKAKPKREFAS